MSHLDLMVDIETLSTGTDAAILSIGAVLFNINTGSIGPKFYRNVDLANSPSPGNIDASTVMWWLKQSDEARQALTQGLLSPLRGVLDGFRVFSTPHLVPDSKGSPAPETIWSNGPTFDERILREAFHRHHIPFPFSYRASRCCRTYYALATAKGMKLTSPEGLTAHNALDDALKQASHMIQIHKELRK